MPTKMAAPSTENVLQYVEYICMHVCICYAKKSSAIPPHLHPLPHNAPTVHRKSSLAWHRKISHFFFVFFFFKEDQCMKKTFFGLTTQNISNFYKHILNTPHMHACVHLAMWNMHEYGEICMKQAWISTGLLLLRQLLAVWVAFRRTVGGRDGCENYTIMPPISFDLWL